jgi:hypothetical protein
VTVATARPLFGSRIVLRRSRSKPIRAATSPSGSSVNSVTGPLTSVVHRIAPVCGLRALTLLPFAV